MGLAHGLFRQQFTRLDLLFDPLAELIE